MHEIRRSGHESRPACTPHDRAVALTTPHDRPTADPDGGATGRGARTRLSRGALVSHIHMCEPAVNLCEYGANLRTRPLRPLHQSHTTSDEISACEYGANMVRTCENLQ